MSERADYPTGVPSWVDALFPDPRRTATFYAELFGWELDDRLGSVGSGPYYVARLHGAPVAGIGPSPAPDVPTSWITYTCVDDVDAATAAALQAGGRLVCDTLPSVDGDRRALLADPSGAVIGVRQRGRFGGAQRVNEPGAWAMSILNTGDAEAAKAFYGAVFGWTTSTFGFEGFELTMWHRPGYVGGEEDQPVSRDVVAAMGPLPDGNAPARWDINFWTSDANATAARAEELGGAVIAPPTDRPGFRDTVVADPTGTTIAVSQLLGR